MVKATPTYGDVSWYLTYAKLCLYLLGYHVATYLQFMQAKHGHASALFNLGQMIDCHPGHWVSSCDPI